MFLSNACINKYVIILTYVRIIKDTRSDIMYNGVNTYSINNTVENIVN